MYPCWRRTLAALATLALLALSAPAGADGPYDLRFDTVRYDGVYQGSVPGGVMIRTSFGPTVILPEGISFSVGGQRVQIGGLPVGSPVLVTVPGGVGQVVGVSGSLIALMLPTGAVQVPVTMIPEGYLARPKVRVLKRNGKVVTVPLNAALNMQRAQGATILGNAPLWTTGMSGPAIVVGSQGEHLLLSAVVGGVPRYYRIPRAQAGGLVHAAPGRPVNVAPGLVVSEWSPGRGHDAGHPGKGPDDDHGKGHGGGSGDDHGKGQGKGKSR